MGNELTNEQFAPRILHVAMKYQNDERRDKADAMIYCPQHISENHPTFFAYTNFFRPGEPITLAPVLTENNPEQLLENIIKYIYDDKIVDKIGSIPGAISTFETPRETGREIMNDLNKSNTLLFYDSVIRYDRNKQYFEQLEKKKSSGHSSIFK